MFTYSIDRIGRKETRPTAGQDRKLYLSCSNKQVLWENILRQGTDHVQNKVFYILIFNL